MALNLLKFLNPAASAATPAMGAGGGGFNPIGGLLNFARKNPEVLMQMSAGLLGGRTGPEQWRMGLGGAAQALGASRERQAEEQRRNMTLEWMRKNAPEYADAVESGALKPIDALRLKSGGGAGGVRYSLQPQLFETEDGELTYGVTGTDGTLKKIDMGGLKPVTGYEKIDLGDRYQLRDKRTGEVIGDVPKNTFEEAEQKSRGAEVGKGRGEAQAKFESVKSKLPGLKQVVSELYDLSNQATYTKAGQLWDEVRRQTGKEPRDAAVARARYEAMVDNQVLPLLRDTFGAAFTVEEGNALRATLGAKDKSPEEKKAVLDAFIQQKLRDVEGLATQAGIAPGGAQGGAAQSPQGGVTPWEDYFNADR